MAFFGKKDRDPAESTLPVPGERREEPSRPEVVPGVARREPASQTTIGPTLRVKGELAGDEDVTIEGRLEGIVSLNRSLIIGKTGIVEADVRALNVIIHGRVVGNIIAEGRVEIHPTGKLEGNIKSPKINIQEGAQFRGNVDMSGGGGAAQIGITETIPARAALPVHERKV